jgi:hypothetical protein
MKTTWKFFESCLTVSNSQDASIVLESETSGGRPRRDKPKLKSRKTVWKKLELSLVLAISGDVR